MEIRLGTFTADLSEPIDISVPLLFNGPQPNAYGVPLASSEACESGDMVGDTRRGGSCNFERYTLIPHCNGTHTECVGHITNERISVRNCLRDSFMPATLISVEPVLSRETADHYAVDLNEHDLLITRDALAMSVGDVQASPSALIVRTLPNDASRLTRRYRDKVPPFFSTDAMEFIVERGFDHLIVDLPSIDRLFDEGKLLNHRLFWDVVPGEFAVNGATKSHRTITELAYIPNDVADGVYLLNLQIAPFAADAAPSRPLLFRATNV